MWFRHCSGFVCVIGVNCFTNHVTVLVAVAFLFFCLHRYLLSSLSLSSFSLFLCCHCHHAPVFTDNFKPCNSESGFINCGGGAFPTFAHGRPKNGFCSTDFSTEAQCQNPLGNYGLSVVRENATDSSTSIY